MNKLKSVDQADPKKITEDAFDDYGVEFNVLKNKALPEGSERGSGIARRRIEEYLEKKRLRELLQEDVVDDVFQ
ncbi:MAG: PA3496 family putative envelope integrity protein [Gammaproteobacteria bacterium]